ncbi:positive regulation of sphingomyelin catabolic process [Pristimantis euphronides]
MVSKRALLEQGGDLVMMERWVLDLTPGNPFLVHEHFTFQTELHIFHGLEYVSGGDFSDHLRQNGPLNIPSARFYAAELVCGIQFLHCEHVIHRDLKPGNILMTETGHLKIGDFGLAALDFYGDGMASGYAGTRGYMAPEILDGLEYDAGVDWYAFGIILRKMVTGYIEDQTTLDKRSGLRNIVKQLLQKDPARRLGVHGTIRKYKFFQRTDWTAVEALRLTPPFIPGAPALRLNPHPFHLDRLEAEEGTARIAAEDQELFNDFSFCLF